MLVKQNFAYFQPLICIPGIRCGSAEARLSIVKAAYVSGQNPKQWIATQSQISASGFSTLLARERVNVEIFVQLLMLTQKIQSCPQSSTHCTTSAVPLAKEWFAIRIVDPVPPSALSCRVMNE